MTGAPRLSEVLEANRRSGRPSLVAYVTGGLPDMATTTSVLEAVVAAGADAVELGVPFSDPIMDGPVIQAGSQAALDAGATPPAVLACARAVSTDVPVGFMTYANLVAHAGWDRFAADAAACGVSAAIVPDLPLEEAGAWLGACGRHGIEVVTFCAPTSPDDRIVANADVASGFLYAVGVLGVTGERETVAQTALELARRAKALTDRPVLVGVGVATPAQAGEVASVADGVVIGSAIVRRVLEAAAPADAVASVGEFVAEVRAALDDVAVDQPAPDPHCDLCEAARLTDWHFEDDLCWIADCEICAVPMVVWRHHGLPSTADAAAMVARLRSVADSRLGPEGEAWYVDGNRRNIPDHWHTHARRRWRL